ncbi:DUF6879 family protein [Umezawaea sp.]|uniref:DUF6879 family protein n=1 Tax=Umezawaea sp. TaxID=1955258 RepID=UPI002ED5FAC2
MTANEYLADFRENFWHDNRGLNWKLERRQEFVESSNESWEASRRNDWKRSIDLLEKGRSTVADYERRISERGMEVRRVRVVEQPISSYLLWELTSLHIRQEVGGKIRVVDRDAVQAYEAGGVAVPELFLLGVEIAYQVLYDEHGVLEGAVKCVDDDEIRFWGGFVADLYDRGEELRDFFDREVARRLPTAS